MSILSSVYVLIVSAWDFIMGVIQITLSLLSAESLVRMQKPAVIQAIDGD